MPGVDVANMSARYMHTNCAKIPRSSRDHEELIKDVPQMAIGTCVNGWPHRPEKLMLESASSAAVAREIGLFGRVKCRVRPWAILLNGWTGRQET